MIYPKRVGTRFSIKCLSLVSACPLVSKEALSLTCQSTSTEIRHQKYENKRYAKMYILSVILCIKPMYFDITIIFEDSHSNIWETIHDTKPGMLYSLHFLFRKALVTKENGVIWVSCFLFNYHDLKRSRKGKRKKSAFSQLE